MKKSDFDLLKKCNRCGSINLLQYRKEYKCKDCGCISGRTFSNPNLHKIKLTGEIIYG